MQKPAGSGMFTAMLKSLRKNDYGELNDVIEAFKPTLAIADALGWPKIWLICPHCGAQSWRVPPHTFGPCPLIEDAAQSQNLKLDAERMTSLRTANTLDEQLATFRAYLDKLTGESFEE